MNIPFSPRQFLLLLAGAMLVTLRVADAAKITIRHPEDGFASIQAAVDAAGCGGTVLVAAGIYDERVLAPCGIQLIGAGIYETVLDGTGLDLSFDPVVGLGNHPLAQFPFSGPYRLAHLTVWVDPNRTAGSSLGVGIGWAKHVALHDLRIENFGTGIDIELSTDASIQNVLVQGRGVGGCIRIRERNLFRDQLPSGHMIGHDVHHNVLENCRQGIILANSVKAAVHDNIIRQSTLSSFTLDGVGVTLAGVGDAVIQHNFIMFFDSGIVSSNLNDSTIHHNTLCVNNVGIEFRSSQTPVLFGFPPSNHNTIHRNTFRQNGQDLVLADPNLGPDNRFHQNTTMPSCPS